MNNEKISRSMWEAHLQGETEIVETFRPHVGPYESEELIYKHAA